MEMGVAARFENGIEVGGERRTHTGVERAKASLTRSGIPCHAHGHRCMNLLKHVLYKDEETLLEAKQHELQSISPIRIVATDKRLIIVYPSFWGLWTGYDLVSPTTYSILPYKYIIGVSMSRGKMLSSLKLHTSSSVDTGSQINDNGEVHGIKTESAINMTRLLEEIIEYIEEPTEAIKYSRQKHAIHSSSPCIITSAEAKRIMAEKHSKLVWVGIESATYISRVMGVPRESILLINPTKIDSYSKEEVAEMEESVILSYDGLMAEHLANFLRYKFSANFYAIDGGLDMVLEESRNNTDASDMHVKPLRYH